MLLSLQLMFKENETIVSGDMAVKHGKYGMLSYRSIVKDHHRTWNLSVASSGNYEVSVVYKMKHSKKDFILKSGSHKVKFDLTGKAAAKQKIELFDGNETHKKTKSKGLASKTQKVGEIQLKKGKNLLELHSGVDNPFVSSIKAFHALDRKYRGLQAEIKQLVLKKI